MIVFENKSRCLFLGVALSLLFPLDFAFAQKVSFTKAPGSPVAVGHAPSTVAVADFNNDGKADLAVVNPWDNTVSILLSGTFSPAPHSPFSTNPHCIGNKQSPLAIAVGELDSISEELLAADGRGLEIRGGALCES